MNISKVTLGKTINIGNYQSVRVEFTADLAGDDTHLSALDHLKVILRNAEDDIKKEQGVKK